MEALLDFSNPFDVAPLDAAVTVFYSGTGLEQQLAQQVLTLFEDHPDAWTRVPAIFDHTSNSQSKFVGLQVLEKLIATRWNSLDDEQRQGIRNFIVKIILDVASTDATRRNEKTLLNKLNLTLVQILKHEWPHNWPKFIPELIDSCKGNLSLCENNMVILKLLSEEIFDYSAEQMTQAKIKTLKAQFKRELRDIFHLCRQILEDGLITSLCLVTLETLYKFLSWIPVEYIFETPIIDLLIHRFLEAPDFRNLTLRCLAEIASLDVGKECDAKLVVMAVTALTCINRMIPPETDIARAYNSSGNSGQELVLNLTLFFTNFLSRHVRAIEDEANRDVLSLAQFYMVKLTEVEEREVFKICVEYWVKLVAELYEESRSIAIGDAALLMGLSLGGADPTSEALQGLTLRKDNYVDALANLRLVVIERMVKPEEVLIVENDEGEVVREFLKDSDTLVLYKSMRELLVYLAHLDVLDTEAILTEKLAKQVDGSEWSWNKLNSLCWAIGSISGVMSEDVEKRFIMAVIKDLLGLTQMKRGKDSKAVCAANIMYIAGQHPRFLKAHWKFLKTLVNKLFEFMHEKHEGVQDMACDTFIKIAQKCRKHFVVKQAGESEPFVDEILRSLDRITSDLSPQQVHTFYEAVGYMIAAQPNRPVREKLIEKLMELPNNAWDVLMAQASQNMDVLANENNVQILSNVLKTNASACSSIGSSFLPQLGRIYLDMLGLYKSSSGIISNRVAQQGPLATKSPMVRHLRTVKKDVLRLMETYIKKADDLKAVNANFVPPLLDAVLGDYEQNVPAARDAEVLNVMATITDRLESLLTPQVQPIMDKIFQPTLEMITKDFQEYPEHRVGFYKFLTAINEHCFSAFPSMPVERFKLFIDVIVWGIKHTMRDIADMGLSLCLDVINNFADAESTVRDAFCQQYLLNITEEIFFVLTDADHKSGFRLQSEVLARVFQIIDSGAVTQPLFDLSDTPTPNMTNPEILRQYCTSLLVTAFPNLKRPDVEEFVDTLAETQNDGSRFKLTLRDFLVELKNFSEDRSALLLDEKEAEALRKAEAEREIAARIPGMLKPSQIEDGDEVISPTE